MNNDDEKYLLRSMVAGHMCRRNIGNFSPEEITNLELLCIQGKARVYYDYAGSNWAETTAAGKERLYELNMLGRKRKHTTTKEEDDPITCDMLSHSHILN
jgi:hypothetical protein